MCVHVIIFSEWHHCMTISIFTAVNFPVNLLHCLCCLTLCASLFLSVHSLPPPPPAAAGLLIVLRLSIDKDIDRYQRTENIRLLL